MMVESKIASGGDVDVSVSMGTSRRGLAVAKAVADAEVESGLVSASGRDEVKGMDLWRSAILIFCAYEETGCSWRWRRVVGGALVMVWGWSVGIRLSRTRSAGC